MAILVRRPLQCSSGRSEEEEKLLAGRTASQKLLEAGKYRQRKGHWRRISGNDHHIAGISTGTDTRLIRAKESGPMTEIRNSDLRWFLSLALPFACMTLGVASARLFVEPPDFAHEAETRI